MQCPECGHENQDEAHYCGACRAVLSSDAVCGGCGRPNLRGQSYCDSCGEPRRESRRRTGNTGTTTNPSSFDSGRYQVKSFLGEGGKKRVYLAEDTRLKKQVAIGIIKTEGLPARERKRLDREVHAMARLGEHPHCVNIYDVVEEDGLVCLVSQYVAGGSLAQLLHGRSDHRLSISEAVRIADELTQALEHTHAHRIVHRDVTPSNILLTPEGEVKLGDYGLAVTVDRSRHSDEGMMVGTAHYMSPEQARGSNTTPQSDLYAVGAVIYEMVTGRPPFLGDNSVAIISQHINTSPEVPSRLEPSVPAALDRLILCLLAKDPSARPESATTLRRALHEIRVSPPELHTQKRPQPNPIDGLVDGVFVGRDDELGSLRLGVDDALAGRLRILMLAGEPGIGKTDTAKQLSTYAETRGARALWGSCYDGEPTRAYWPWSQVIRDYVRSCDLQTLRSELGLAAADIARVVSEVRKRLPDLPEPPRLDAEDARFRLFEGIAAFLRSACARRPLAIFLDDLHWADRSSLLLLKYLVGELDATRLLVVGTFRDAELERNEALREMLAELARHHQGERITLGGLTREEVGKFIEETTLIVPAPPLVEKVYAQTEGNPFFVHEVVRLLAQSERIGENASWSSEIPPNVRELIGIRFSRLSESCNQTLRTAAVLGREFDARILERVADLPENTLFAVLDEACGARVIEKGGERAEPLRFRFAHALIHQQLYEELNAPRRMRIHQRAGEALEQVHAHRLGPRLSEIAHHYSQALEIVGTTRVVEAAVRAGEWGRDQHAYGEAAHHYRVAVDALDRMEEPESLRICELLVELGRLQELAGESGGAHEAGRRAVALARRLGAMELFARATLVYSMDAFVEPWRMNEGAVALLEEALTAVGSEDSPLRARLLDSLARHLTPAPDPESRRRFWEEARAIAGRLEDPALLLDVTPALALWDRKLEDWLPAAEEKVGLARSLGPGALFDALALRGTARLRSGDVAGMLADHEEMERLADELRTPYARYQTRLRRAMRATLLGELDDASRLAQDAFDFGKIAFEQTALQNFLAQMFVILIHRGALRVNRAAGEVADRFPDPVYRAIYARCFAAEGAREQAAEQFERLAREDFRDVTAGLNWGTTMCLLADVCDYLEDERRAELLYERLCPHASHFAVGGESGAGQIGPVGMRLGMLASLLRRFDEAQRHFEATIAWAAGTGLRPWLAHTRFGYARMLLARDEAGDQQRALEQLNLALELGSELGMRGIVEDDIGLKLALQGHDTGSFSNSIQRVANSVRELRPDLTHHAGPDGTMTLVFSDIEDYTGMLVRLGDVRAHVIMRDHNAMVREEAAAHGGREVELRGDGFLLAFAAPEPAVRFAVALQRDFAAYNSEHPEQPIHIRIGLHTGEVIRDADGFFGSSVVKASRVADMARGREILVSHATLELVRDAGDLDFDEGREVELKGMRGTHRVHSVHWE